MAAGRMGLTMRPYSATAIWEWERAISRKRKAVSSAEIREWYY